MGKQSARYSFKIIFPRFSFSEETNFLNLRIILHLHLTTVPLFFIIWVIFSRFLHFSLWTYFSLYSLYYTEEGKIFQLIYERLCLLKLMGVDSALREGCTSKSQFIRCSLLNFYVGFLVQLCLMNCIICRVSKVTDIRHASRSLSYLWLSREIF